MRQKTKTVKLILCIPIEEKRALRRIAQTEGGNLSAVVRRALADYLDRMVAEGSIIARYDPPAKVKEYPLFGDMKIDRLPGEWQQFYNPSEVGKHDE